MVVYITTEEELSQVFEDNKDKVVLVDFFANWCVPCKKIAPAFDGLTTLFPDVVLLKVNYDDSEDLVEEYEIESLPSFLFFKNGEEVDRVKGEDLKILVKSLEKQFGIEREQKSVVTNVDNEDNDNISTDTSNGDSLNSDDTSDTSDEDK